MLTPTLEPSATGLTTTGSGNGSASVETHRLGGRYDEVCGDGDSGNTVLLLGQRLIKTEHAGTHPLSSVGNLQPVEHTLNATVLTVGSMQCVKDHIEVSRLEVVDIPMAWIDSDNGMTQALKGSRNSLTRIEADLALSGDASIRTLRGGMKSTIGSPSSNAAKSTPPETTDQHPCHQPHQVDHVPVRDVPSRPVARAH